jgi:hypothetical protein
LFLDNAGSGQVIVTVCQDFSFALELLKNLKIVKKISTPCKDCKPNRHADAVDVGAWKYRCRYRALCEYTPPAMAIDVDQKEIRLSYLPVR